MPWQKADAGCEVPTAKTEIVAGGSRRQGDDASWDWLRPRVDVDGDHKPPLR